MKTIVIAALSGAMIWLAALVAVVWDEQERCGENSSVETCWEALR